VRFNPEGSALNHVVDDRRRCKKTSPSVLFCLDESTKEGYDRGSKVGTVHSGLGGKAQNEPEGIWQERIMRKISSPGRIAGCLSFAITNGLEPRQREV